MHDWKAIINNVCFELSMNYNYASVYSSLVQNTGEQDQYMASVWSI